MTFQPQVGDIVLTRNAGDDRHENRSPGFYNHLAICIGKDIIEAQEHVTLDGKCSDDESLPGGVILTPWFEFDSRYPIVLVRRMTLYRGESERVIDSAMSMLGCKYERAASVFPRHAMKAGAVNCVSLVAEILHSATSQVFDWRRPDDAGDDGRFLNVVEKDLLVRFQ